MTNNNEPMSKEQEAELEKKYKFVLDSMTEHIAVFQEIMYTLTAAYTAMTDEAVMAMPKETANLVLQALAFANATILRTKRLEDERLARVRASN